MFASSQLLQTSSRREKLAWVLGDNNYRAELDWVHLLFKQNIHKLFMYNAFRDGFSGWKERYKPGILKSFESPFLSIDFIRVNFRGCG